jgi:hypothetical protein
MSRDAEQGALQEAPKEVSEADPDPDVLRIVFSKAAVDAIRPALRRDPMAVHVFLATMGAGDDDGVSFTILRGDTLDTWADPIRRAVLVALKEPGADALRAEFRALLLKLDPFVDASAVERLATLGDDE